MICVAQERATGRGIGCFRWREAVMIESFADVQNSSLVSACLNCGWSVSVLVIQRRLASAPITYEFTPRSWVDLAGTIFCD